MKTLYNNKKKNKKKNQTGPEFKLLINTKIIIIILTWVIKPIEFLRDKFMTVSILIFSFSFIFNRMIMINIRIENIKSNRDDILIQKSISKRNQIKIDQRNGRPRDPIDHVQSLPLTLNIKPDLIRMGSIQHAECQKKHQYTRWCIYKLTCDDLTQHVQMRGLSESFIQLEIPIMREDTNGQTGRCQFTRTNRVPASRAGVQKDTFDVLLDDVTQATECYRYADVCCHEVFFKEEIFRSDQTWTHQTHQSSQIFDIYVCFYIHFDALICFLSC